MKSNFSGVQQIGIGVKDAAKAFDWYRNELSFPIRLFDDVATASLMKNYTGSKEERRRAILALNKAGGGGLEIWQFLDRNPAARPDIHKGSLGILGAIAGRLPMNLIKPDIFWSGSLGVTDPFGNTFLAGSAWEKGKAGIRGAAIGVSNLSQSEAFYCDVLGFEKVKEEDITWDGTKGQLVSLKLNPKPALFANLLGGMELRLICISDEKKKEHLFNNRFWGDLGFIHLCFETPNMSEFKSRVSEKGVDFKVDSEDSFGMSDASGRFAYIEDPDGTLIELVETHKIPVHKKLGISVDLAKYKSKPIEQWKLKIMNWFQ